MSNSTTANGGTVLTIPPNSLWRGSVSLCATLAVAIAGAAATQYPAITVSGANATWPDGDIVLKLALFVPAVGVTALTGSQATASVSTGDITVRTRGSALSLVLSYGTGVTAVGTAIGETLNA